MNPIYPRGAVKSLLESDAVTIATRAVLESRLAPASNTAPQFFSLPEIEILRAVAARLVPQNDLETLIDLAAPVDARLSQNAGNGWRYDALPPDGEMLKIFFKTLENGAQTAHGAGFSDLDAEKQDELLAALQKGALKGESGPNFDAPRAFEELLAELVENFVAHPLAQEDIGYAGFADLPGWTKIGLDERENREPIPIGTNTLRRESQTEEKEEVQAPKPEIPPFSAPRLSVSARNQDEVDAVIIGTGAGGAPLLARLAGAGLRVVALEAGAWHDPTRDFATDEKSQAKLFWNDERLSAGADPMHFGSNNSGTGVGGSTLHYTAYTPRVQPDDLRLHTEFGAARDWPLSYDDLEPYYDEIEAFLGISGPNPYPWGPPRKTKYPLAPLPLNGAAQLMARGCEKLGIKTSPAANAALSARYFVPGVGWRAACTNRGFCQAGCTTGAKGSMDVTFLPLAVANGAEIRPNSFVTRIETQNGRVSGVVYLQNGREERQKCKAVFLCGGAIESPRLLLLNDLLQASGQVGRNFMAHTGMQLWGQFEEMVRPFKGIPGALISEDTHRPQNADFAGGYLLQSIGVMPTTYASQFAHGKPEEGAGRWGNELREHLREYNHTAGINILGEGLPYDHNYVELSDELDGRGLPKPRVHFTAGDNEKRLHAHARRVMGEIFEAAGAKNTWAFERYAHIIGTCRMGNDAQNDVVDADCRSFEIPNLYICDNSVFPSSLSVNPALTIMALSLRTADRFLASR